MFSKGQKSGADAWILILLITLALVGFVLFLPEADRQALLDGTPTAPDTRYVPEEGRPGEFLLQEHIGRLEFYPPGPLDHPIGSVHLYRTTRSEVMESYNPFVVERGTFSGASVTKRFTLDNLQNMENVLLTLDTSIREGSLTVYLNGQLVAQVEGESGFIAPITLKQNLLQRENTLTFDVSSPGWRIWRLHKFQIESAQVLADVNDPSKQQAMQQFIVSPVEHRNILASELRFIAECDPFSVGPLEISVNGRVAYRAIPDCDTVNLANVDPSAFVEGSNTVQFKAMDGEYRLNSIIFSNDVKDVRTFVEYFEIDPDLYDAVLLNARDVYLELDFVDDGQRKRATLNVNGHLTSLDQREPFYARNLNVWLQPGLRNYVEIVPETPLNIVEARVVVR